MYDADGQMIGSDGEGGTKGSLFSRYCEAGKAYTLKCYSGGTVDRVGTVTIEWIGAEKPTADAIVTVEDQVFVYDGEPHSAEVSVELLTEDLTVESAVSGASVTHVAEGKLPAFCDRVVIVDAEGNDVTAQLYIEYDSGTIGITPAALTVTTESDSRYCTGEPLTATGKCEGFVSGETATFTVTGSQTEIGSSPNTYSLVFDGSAVESDYEIASVTLGTLKVIEEAIHHVNAEGTCSVCGKTFSTEGLNVLNVPASLLQIDDEAFTGIAARAVVLPDGCQSVGSRAFADCPQLEYVFAPEGLEFPADVFGDGEVRIIYYESGEAQN